MFTIMHSNDFSKDMLSEEKSYIFYKDETSSVMALIFDKNSTDTCLDYYFKRQLEECVLCGVPTEYFRSTHTDLRYNFVDGVGQLCRTCGN